MAHALWKGAISFGLVHIPVALYSSTKRDDLDFDWLDKRDMKPVGYKRVNKETGGEVGKDDIVKGLKTDSGRYVVLSDAEIKAAYPKASQLVEIVSFVDGAEIEPAYYDTPYLLAPMLRGEKVYALLRETLARTGKVGIAHVVIQTRQHLAALMPAGAMLQLLTLRWADELRAAPSDVELPPQDAKAAGLTTRELDMAQALVDDMTQPWEPDRWHDDFRAQILELVERKVEAGDTRVVALSDTPASVPTTDVADLAALLKRSLQGGGRQRTPGPRPGRSAPKRASALRPAAHSEPESERDGSRPRKRDATRPAPRKAGGRPGVASGRRKPVA